MKTFLVNIFVLAVFVGAVETEWYYGGRRSLSQSGSDRSSSNYSSYYSSLGTDYRDVIKYLYPDSFDGDNIVISSNEPLIINRVYSQYECNKIEANKYSQYKFD